MATDGIEAIFVTTHNWGRAAKFFQGLGFELECATDHDSGQLRNGAGPYVFVAEVPPDEAPSIQVVMRLAGAPPLGFDPAIEVLTPFAETHYGTREMTVHDPDGRLRTLQEAARR